MIWRPVVRERLSNGRIVIDASILLSRNMYIKQCSRRATDTQLLNGTDKMATTSTHMKCDIHADLYIKLWLKHVTDNERSSLLLTLFTSFAGLTYHINGSFTSNDLAVRTHFLHASTYFHDFSILVLKLFLLLGEHLTTFLSESNKVYMAFSLRLGLTTFCTIFSI